MNPTTISPRRARRASLVLAAAVSSCVIAACGSGATTTSTTSSSSKAASASAKTGSGKGRSTFVACLEQHGVTPPPGGGAGPGSGSGTRTAPPQGASSGNSTRATAFKDCGATGHRPPASGG
jgi:hypothetical protein